MQIEYKNDKILFKIDKEGTVFDESLDLKHEIGYSLKGKLFNEFIESGVHSTNIKKNDAAVFEVNNSHFLHWNGEIQITDIDGDFKWYDVHLIPITAKAHHYTLVVGSDITQATEDKTIAEENIIEEVTSKMKKKEYRTHFILEGEEKERERVARELHDGMGQMLTALNLSLEAISDNKGELKDVKKLTKVIIQEARRLSFNLRPTYLTDYGLIPAINKFCNYAKKISPIHITFNHNFINKFRLDNEKELHIYRIVQELINNALKHSNAKNIEVNIEGENNSIISVKDDGVGFIFEDIKNDENGFGFGLANIKKRCSLINAKLDINSTTGKGTNMKITLNT